MGRDEAANDRGWEHFPHGADIGVRGAALDSPEAHAYLGAMRAGINCARANRHIRGRRRDLK